MNGPLTIGSLFAGIGGLELGLERAGVGHTVWQVEIDPYCRAVLAKHWPDAKRYDDVRTAGAHNLARVDVICGGFPCQDISVAGDGVGIDVGARSGLWREYARLIRELRPRFVVVENVSALLVRGLGRVLGDLAACGYDAQWDCIPASAVGAPHRRDRVFVVAYPRQERVQGIFAEAVPRFPAFSWSEDVRGPEDLRGRSDLPPPLFRGTRDGIPAWVDRLGVLGNAVCPQVAEVIGQRILQLRRSAA